MKNQISQYWFQTRKFKIILIVVAVIAVVLVVLFSEQIGNLLDRDVSEAGTAQTIILDSSNLPDGTAEGDLAIVGTGTTPNHPDPIRLELAPWAQGSSDQ